ncbi:MAG: ComEC/Rec2 family competence protein [Peptococcus niger]
MTAGPPVCRLQDLATVLQKRLTASLSPDSASLTRAILLGETAGLHPDFYHRGQLLGMVHIFAVSGLHVGMILAFIMALLRLVQVQSLGARLIAAGPLLTGYALLVGAPPSAVRAVVMAFIALWPWEATGMPTRRAYFYAAAAALVIMDPYCLWQIGFQLSFIITGGLILLAPPLQHLLAPTAGLANPGRGLAAE